MQHSAKKSSVANVGSITKVNYCVNHCAFVAKGRSVLHGIVKCGKLSACAFASKAAHGGKCNSVIQAVSFICVKVGHLCLLCLYNYNIGTNSGCNKFFAQTQARGIK